MPISEYTRDQLTAYWFTDESVDSRPTGLHIALIKDNGDEVDDGADDANYARQAVSFETYGTTGRARNASSVTFAAAATGSSYTVEAFAVFDAETGGNELGRADLEFPKDVVDDTAISFGAGDLVVGLDEGAS